MNWNKVTALIQPRSTQALFVQQFWLIRVEGDVAYIGCGSEKLLQQGKQKISSLESAIVKAGYSYRVVLQVAEKNQIQVTPTSVQASRPSTNRNRVQPVIDSDPIYNVVPESKPIESEDEVMAAAISLARFFNGVLVSTIEK